MYYINRVQPQLKFLVGVYIKGCCWSGIHLLARPAVACFPNRTWSLLRPLQSYPVHRRCFIFLFVLLKNIGELASQACTREHYLALAVNKPPAVHILSPALHGLNLVPRFSLLPWGRGYDGLKGLWTTCFEQANPVPSDSSPQSTFCGQQPWLSDHGDVTQQVKPWVVLFPILSDSTVY